MTAVRVKLEASHKMVQWHNIVIVICKKVGMGLCAPPSLLVLALQKLGAVPPNVGKSCI